MFCIVKFDCYKNSILDIFNANTQIEVSNNYNETELVLHFYQGYIFNNVINVRMSHGGGYWQNYTNVSFETKAYMEHELLLREHKCITTEVIHPWFYKEHFIYNPSDKYKIPTFLFMARCSVYKGIDCFLNYSKYFPQYNFIIAGADSEYDDETRKIIRHKDSYIS